MSSKDLNVYNRKGIANPENDAKPGEDQIKVDGFAQVIQLLQVADSSFRESLLKRLALKDPTLARNLRNYLNSNN